MRLYLKLSAPKEPIPFNHINILSGALHKWLGPNDEHDGLSLYSFSWLGGSKSVKNGLIFPNGAEWFISSIDGSFLRQSIEGIFQDPEIRWGMRVEEVTMRVPPVFPVAPTEQRFRVASPVFYKRKIEDGSERHFLFSDHETDGFLTENLRFKLRKSGLDDTGAAVRFDRSYPSAMTKLVKYANKYEFRASMCPLILNGTGEQLAFAWSVGVGQGTGIGFGSLV